MRTHEEITQVIAVFKAKNSTPTTEAIIEVLEEDLTYEEIENKFFDDSDPWVEQSAIKAREWLDGEIESDDIF